MSLVRNVGSSVGTSATKKAASWIAIAAAVGAGLVVIAGAEGCTVSTDVNDGGFQGTDANTPDSGTDSGTDSAADTSTPPVNACNECLFGQCSGQWTVCMNNADCQAIYACATAPGCSGNCP